MIPALYEKLGEEWYLQLQEIIESPEFDKLGRFLASERAIKLIYPFPEDYFKAFKLVPFSKVTVVIIGQDPYFNGGADGLAFSVNKKDNIITKCPLSLLAIFDEIEADIYNGFRIEQDWCLERWAEQGVFLLNTILSVEAKKPKSHACIGWEAFTEYTIKKLSEDFSNRKVFLLWGNDAKVYKNIIDSDIHLILTCSHPATKNREIDYWTGNKHFSQTNEFLKIHNKQIIQW